MTLPLGNSHQQTSQSIEPGMITSRHETSSILAESGSVEAKANKAMMKKNPGLMMKKNMLV